MRFSDPQIVSVGMLNEASPSARITFHQAAHVTLFSVVYVVLLLAAT